LSTVSLISSTVRKMQVGVLILLNGCMAGPNYRPAVPAVAPTYVSQATLSARSTGQPTPPLNTWWTGFDDPELVRIIGRVLEQNLDLSAALARVAQARAVAREAGARELPEAHLDGTVDALRQSLNSPIGSVARALPGYERDQTLRDVDAGASWEIDLFGGLRRGAEAAGAEAQAAEALKDGVRISVAAEAAASADYVVPAIDTGDGPAELLRQRPDVIAAERRLAASNARIGVATAEYYPKVSLTALLGFESLNGAALFNSASFQPEAVGGLRWRLFDFGQVDAEVAQAKGANVEALAEYRQSMLRATEDVENAVVQLIQLEAQYGELQDEVSANVRARGAAQQQYVAGVVSLLEVLDADRQLLSSRDALAQVHADDARAAVEAFRALGGGWTPAKVQAASRGGRSLVLETSPNLSDEVLQVVGVGTGIAP